MFDAHAPTRHLNFLKVNAEGSETAVIAGPGFEAVSPRLVSSY